jgi:SAM-dependent methyltransferase
MDIQRFTDYETFAWIYNRHWGNISLNTLPVIERFVLKHIPAGGSILDLCCGTGQMASELSSRDYRVTGVDGSQEMIQLARMNAPDATFIVDDARTFKCSSSFEAILSLFDSLNHVMYIDDLELVFRNVFQALKPGGMFFFDLNMEAGYRKNWMNTATNIVEEEYVCAVCCSYDSKNRIGSFRATLFRWSDGWEREDIMLYQKCYTKNEVLSALKKAGFQRMKSLSTDENLGLDIIGRRFFLAYRTD